MNETITSCRYRHYKGKEYTVIGVALHSETQEELVVYRQEYGDHGLWVRPKQMFPDDERQIVSARVVMVGNDYRIEVASATLK